MAMDTLPGRFTGITRFLGSSGGSHQSFRLTPTSSSLRVDKKAKIQAIGRTMQHGYIGDQVKKELKNVEEQIAHAVGRGDTTFTDAHGVEHKITEEMRYFAKEAREGGHTLTRKSELKRFAEGYVETTREEGIKLRSGYNIGSEKEVAGKIVKAEETAMNPTEKMTALQERMQHRQAREQRHARIGLPTGPATGSLPPTPTATVQDVQHLPQAEAPAKAAALRPSGLVMTGFVAGDRTVTHDHTDEPIVVAPPTDPIAEQNQTVAESIPPANDVDLPDTTNVDRGLPF